MKRSTQVQLTIVASVAAAFGCDRPMQCVDEHDVVVSQESCTNTGEPDDAGVYHPAGSVAAYRWYYGGTTVSPGSRISGGSYAPVSGEAYATPRGGFGVTAEGEGFGGAHGVGVGE